MCGPPISQEKIEKQGVYSWYLPWGRKKIHWHRPTKGPTAGAVEDFGAQWIVLFHNTVPWSSFNLIIPHIGSSVNKKNNKSGLRPAVPAVDGLAFGVSPFPLGSTHRTSDKFHQTKHVTYIFRLPPAERTRLEFSFRFHRRLLFLVPSTIHSVDNYLLKTPAPSHHPPRSPIPNNSQGDEPQTGSHTGGLCFRKRVSALDNPS